MTFVSAAFLFAAAAGAIPVALHMINRQQAKKLPFSTLRFLRISAEKTRRRKRIHDVLLMLLRVAVLVLIAIGLSEPTMTTLGSFWGSGASAVAVIVDNSASMGIIDEGRPRFETAREATRDIMRELADGDQIAIMLTGGPEFAEQGRLHRTQDRLLQMLDQVEVSYERADLALKVQEARAMLDKTDSPHKQIFVLTDMQQLSWEGLHDAVDAPGSDETEDHEEIPVIFVDCNRNPKPNVAVSGLAFERCRPRCRNADRRIHRVIQHLVGTPEASCGSFILTEPRKRRSPELEVPPQGRTKHEFQFAFKRGGTHRGEVRLVGKDGSQYDDRRYFSMEVDQGISRGDREVTAARNFLFGGYVLPGTGACPRTIGELGHPHDDADGGRTSD